MPEEVCPPNLPYVKVWKVIVDGVHTGWRYDEVGTPQEELPCGVEVFLHEGAADPDIFCNNNGCEGDCVLEWCSPIPGDEADTKCYWCRCEGV